MSISDAIAIVDNLDPEAIRAELHNLNGRADALRVLLRSAVARQRHVNRGVVQKIQGQGKPGVQKGGAGAVHA